MARDIDRLRQFSRRSLVLGAGQLGLFGVLAGRLYYLQVVEGERYATLAEDNRINLRLLPPVRGPILDRFGRPMAENIQNFQITLVPEQVSDLTATLARLSRLVALDDATLERVAREVARQRAFVPITVAENLSWEEMARVEVNAPDLPGVSITVGDIRHYPLGAAAAHLVGYVGAPTEAEADGDPVMLLPGFRVGKTGLEKAHETDLRGTTGSQQIEVNALGRVIRELNRTEGQPGGAAVMTIDAALQQAVQDRLGQERAAAAVVMDAHTGAIYALGSSPAFDPNLFAKGIPRSIWLDLTSDETAPLTNKAVGGQYPPGSTFKMMTALAALEAGAITPDHTVYCPGHMDLGGHRFHCWKSGGHGTMGLIEAIAQSCDTFFYDLARKVGIDAIADMSRRFGLGERLGLALEGERAGLIPTREWKRGRYAEPWQGGDSLNAAIGQGYVLTTPLQLAVMTARIANGGRAVTPYLTERVGAHSHVVPEAPLIDVDPAHLALIQRGMIAVMNGSRGTARGSQIDDPAWQMAGKTGTAQVKRITAAERAAGIRNSDLPWRFRHHALFVAYAPMDRPRYAVSVVVEHGGGGSSTAAPLARDLVDTLRRLDPARRDTIAGVAPSDRGEG